MTPGEFELTLEQQFQMKLMEESAEQMTVDQMKTLLLQTARLLMVKDNVIRNLAKDGLNGLHGGIGHGS